MAAFKYRSQGLGFEFGPARVELIEGMLRLLHGMQYFLQAHGIGGHCRIF